MTAWKQIRRKKFKELKAMILGELNEKSESN